MASTNRRGRATEERIRSAALEVLVTRGLDLTIDEVAEAAGISRMTVHRHVGTRQALLMDLVVEATDRFAEQLAQIFDSAAPFAERLLDAFVFVITSARSAPDQQAMALAIADPSDGWGSIDPDGRIMREVLEFLHPRLVAGAKETPFRADVDDTLAWLLRQAQLYLLVPGTDTGDTDALRREVRTFVLPAVLLDVPGEPGREPHREPRREPGREPRREAAGSGRRTVARKAGRPKT